MVKLTNNAVHKIQELLESASESENALRIFIKPGGCSGFSYGLALDALKSQDHVFKIQGISVVVDSASLDLVKGSEVDYVQNFTGEGFQIWNPNAISTCGCGSSFHTNDQVGQPGSCL
ncbi:iron-sulfur cluster assembly accessory protein [Alicyclobacillaceae bacterium I2511]|nr:iron-sulfur cluster assembly accessory protein [Alicyclobacillaceae bacterium I2511]